MGLKLTGYEMVTCSLLLKGLENKAVSDTVRCGMIWVSSTLGKAI